MVLLTFDADFERQAKQVDAAVADVPEMQNQVVRVNRPG